jgi:hypothetical protein
MPADGPSKEQLEYYFKNSRQYFDELAKQFYDSDRDYYNKFIAPFYGSPFGGAPHKTNSAGSRSAVFLVAGAVVALLVAGISFFLTLQKPDDTNYEQKKEIEETHEKARSKPDEQVKQPDSQTESNKKLSDYDNGLKFYNQKDYDVAQRYFNKVTKDDDNYDDAQNKIEQIKKLRNENSSGNEKERNRRVQPIEKIR